MNTVGKIAAFAAGLAVVFGAAFAAGSVVADEAPNPAVGPSTPAAQHDH